MRPTWQTPRERCCSTSRGVDGPTRWSRPPGSAESVLPDVYESPEVCAHVSRDAAAATGLVAGTPIVAGAGDQAAGAVGMGITRPGAVSVTIGTSGVVFAATETSGARSQGTYPHVLSRGPGPMARHGRHAGGRAVAALDARPDRCRGRPAWTKRLTRPTTASSMKRRRVPPGSDGVIWAPYLMGERTPHCDPDVRAALVGLAAEHTRGHVIRAVLEGVAFSLRDTFGIFGDLGVPVVNVRVGGGGARSAVWRQIQADTYGRPVETSAGRGRCCLRRRHSRRRRRRPVVARWTRRATTVVRAAGRTEPGRRRHRRDERALRPVHPRLPGASHHLSILTSEPR